MRPRVGCAVKSAFASILLLASCGPATPAASTAPPASGALTPREPIALTYLGVAGWQLEAAGKIILADPYFSRPALADQPLVPDDAAIAAHAPAKADLIVIGHSHHDHLLDAPTVAKRTGAQLLGSLTTSLVARASGVPDDRIITVKGGEDFAMDGYSVRVIPSLHSAIGDKHIFGAALTTVPTLPMPHTGYAEGGTFGYLIRLGGHEVLVLSTANFIERELEGLRPDIAIVGVGLREEVHDYSCRLVRALGAPPRIYANHFDNWREPPRDDPPDADVLAFVDEVHRCAPATEVVIPKHFDRMLVP
jgi:L-ascorbate metabolism protein UlaG (beta-lactamase superfamily)